MATSKKQYDSDNIKNLQFPESIRQKPTLYIGPIDERGVLTILREVMDNVVDEALEGRVTEGDVFMQKTLDGGRGASLKGFYVLDNGGGIPVKPMKIRNPIDNTTVSIPAIKAILSLTHTSGKFDDSSYTASRGTHGLGVKASNALSRVYRVWTYRDNFWWEIAFARGMITKELTKCAAPKHPGTGKPLKKGTLVYLEPDPKIFTVMENVTLEKMFGAATLMLKAMLEWCRLASYFTPGFTIRVHHYSGNTKEFYSENGPKDFIDRKLAVLNKEAQKDNEAIDVMANGGGDFIYRDPLVECVVAFTNADGSHLDAFTNGLRNVEGGVHVDAFMLALKTSITPYAPKKSTFTIRELREGLVALINVKLSAPQFDSQTKEKLVDERGGKPAQDVLTESMTKFFAKHKSLAIAICERANNIHALKSKFQASKKVINALRSIARKGLPVKASIAPNCKPFEREMFIIEGDSAAGSARAARNAYYQETLPIRGKVLNALRDPKGRAIESPEIINILAQIGYDPKAEDPYDKLRVGKIVCLADPDPDGPLIGSTEVLVRRVADKVWHQVCMSTLASTIWEDDPYEVLAWTGYCYKLVPALDCKITDYVNKKVKITLASGVKLECSENHRWPILKSRVDDRVEHFGTDGLSYVAASKLKTGDRLVSVDEDGLRHEPHNVSGIQVLHSSMIEKIKVVSCDLEPMYCLTVPEHHNFVLSCGVLSKNCHINSLLLTLFYKFLPELFNRGMVYVAEVPEFYAIDKAGKFYSAGKTEILAGILAKAGVKADICHIKGYGEISAAVLRTLAFDPATRVLSRIIPTETANGEVEFTKLMGNDSEARKKLLGI